MRRIALRALSHRGVRGRGRADKFHGSPGCKIPSPLELKNRKTPSEKTVVQYYEGRGRRVFGIVVNNNSNTFVVHDSPLLLLTESKAIENSNLSATIFLVRVFVLSCKVVGIALSCGQKSELIV